MRSTINVCFVAVGNVFSVFFLLFLVCTGLGSGLDFFSFVLFGFVTSVLTCFNFVATLSLGFVGLFFSENYTRYM